VSDGPTHRYIGASAGCWALFTPLSAGCAPDADLVTHSEVPDVAPQRALLTTPPGTAALLADAYAAQHHGGESAQAIQSVAAHLLTLYGVFRAGVAPAHAEWPRRRALRTRGVYHKLQPPALGSALTIRHLFPGGGVDEPCAMADYVASVFAVWEREHGPQLVSWYERFVLK
jgi:hypothetical protein